MTRKNEAILKAIDRSMTDGTPIPIDHLPLIDVNRHFSEEEISKRRARRKDKETEECRQER